MPRYGTNCHCGETELGIGPGDPYFLDYRRGITRPEVERLIEETETTIAVAREIEKAKRRELGRPITLDAVERLRPAIVPALPMGLRRITEWAAIAGLGLVAWRWWRKRRSRTR